MKISELRNLEKLLKQEPLPCGKIDSAIVEYIHHYDDDTCIQGFSQRYERKMVDNS